MPNQNRLPIQSSRRPPTTAAPLSPDEIFLLKLIRATPHQEVLVKVKDGVIIILEQKTKFIRNKKGGFPF